MLQMSTFLRREKTHPSSHLEDNSAATVLPKPWQLRRPSCAPNQLLLPPVEESSSFHTLRSASDGASDGFCSLSRNSCRSASRLTILLLAGLIVVRVISAFGIRHLLKHRLVPYTSVASIDFLVHLNKLFVQVLTCRSLDTFVDLPASTLAVLNVLTHSVFVEQKKKQ